MIAALTAFACVFVLSFCLGLAVVRHRERRLRAMRARKAIAPTAEGPAAPRTDPLREAAPAPAAGGASYARLPLSTRQGALLGAALVIALTGALILLAGMGPIVAALQALAITGAVGVVAVRRWQEQEQARLIAPLPEALDALSRSLRAGRTLPDAFGFLAGSVKGPLGVAFGRVGTEIAHGASSAEALGRMAQRSAAPEFAFLASAVAIQAETGGNLADTLDNLARAMRERRKIEAKSRALSAEMRVSAAILAALPAGVGAILALMNPDYMAPLVQDGRGRWMLAYALASVGCGVALMKRMGRLDD